MLDFTLSGRTYFDDLPQPVLLYGERIEYCNAAARSLFALIGAPVEPGQPRPEQLPPPEQAPCTLTLQLDSRAWSLTLRKMDALALCQLTPLREESAAELEPLHRLSLQLRLRLSLTALSVERLQSELSELEQLRSWEPVAKVNRNLHRLLRLSDHLDLYTRTPQELTDLYPAAALDLNAFCRELEDKIAPLAKQLGHPFVFEDCERSLHVQVNDQLLQRLLYNLISNALNAGGSLRLRLREGQEAAVLTLSDTGKGISPARLQSLFSLEQDGTGEGFALGMALCRRIVQLYGGQLMVAPAEQGTTVSLSLPLYKGGSTLRNSRRRPEPGYDLLLTELSDILPDGLFGQDEVF
jgi:signal transduction histidine kinase